MTPVLIDVLPGVIPGYETPESDDGGHTHHSLAQHSGGGKAQELALLLVEFPMPLLPCCKRTLMKFQNKNITVGVLLASGCATDPLGRPSIQDRLTPFYFTS